MSVSRRKRWSEGLRAAAIVLLAGAVPMASAPSHAVEPGDLERDLDIGARRLVGLDEAMEILGVPSVSFALIEGDRIALARAHGDEATPDTLFQAASLSKFVAAVGAMRLVDQGKLQLDQDVNAKLTSWKVPANSFDQDHPVTLRGLLSMTAGIGVPGFSGYQLGAALPNSTQILYGVPPANSPPVTVIAPPGSGFAYSGGSYQIAEALMSDAGQAPFAQLMAELVLTPAGMARSSFAQPLPQDREAEAAPGHDDRGRELPGSWRIYPEFAAAGLWSTPTDIANLLLQVARAWRGESSLFLKPETAREMLKAQNGGPYGLGAAISQAGGSLVVMKRGQNVGYQAYLILLPAEGQGLVVLTNSDNGSQLAEVLIRRAAKLYGWPEIGPLQD